MNMYEKGCMSVKTAQKAVAEEKPSGCRKKT